MRLVKTLSMLSIIGILTASAVAGTYDRFGKGALTIGTTPPGVSTYSGGGGYVYARQYVQPAPIVATVPATDGRRTFSVEPSTTNCTAPAASAAVPATDGRRTFSVAPSTAQPAAPAVRVMSTPRASGQEYNRFGKGPTTIGLTPPGFGS